MKKFGLLLCLAACTDAQVTVSAAAPFPSGDADTCNAGLHTQVIGQNVTALERVLILGQVRLIRPDTLVTQDFVMERINFHIGQDERIQRIACG